MYWFSHGGHDDLLLLLQPGLEVSAIDPLNHTMTLRGVHEFFVVRCSDACGTFTVGDKYHMLYRGEVLDYKRHGRMLHLPIVQQHVDFGTVEGGRG